MRRMSRERREYCPHLETRYRHRVTDKENLDIG
jgi:hypothetical protein